MSALGLSSSAGESSVLSAATGYCADLGLSMTLGDHGATQQDIRSFAEEAFAIKRLIDNNPRVLQLGDIEAIYREAL